MNIDWYLLTVCVVWLSAAVGYAFHDGGDPWFFATIGTVLILLGKAWK